MGLFEGTPAREALDGALGQCERVSVLSHLHTNAHTHLHSLTRARARAHAHTMPCKCGTWRCLPDCASLGGTADYDEGYEIPIIAFSGTARLRGTPRVLGVFGTSLWQGKSAKTVVINKRITSSHVMKKSPFLPWLFFHS